MTDISTVCTVGLGYIGLPTSAFMAKAGLQVLGVDINEKHVETINNGAVPFFEPGFESLLKEVVANGSLRASTSPETADAYIIAVPTPFKEGYQVNTAYIEAAARSVGPFLRPGALVVLESTSPPGTTEHMAKILSEARPDLSIDPGKPNAIFIAHCPERVLPGQIMEEMSTNDRVVGGLTPEAAKLAKSLYQTFCKGEILITDATTAEMAKLTENSFRDVNIAFANELSLIAEDLGINVWELIEIANHHPRVNILQPGPGVGGHCIAVDPWFIVSSAPETSRLIRTAREVNDGKPEFVLNKVRNALHNDPNLKVAALGIAFKANIDDLRESPALAIVKKLASEFPSSTVNVVEPNITELPPSLQGIGNVNFSDVDRALSESGIILLLVDHSPFKDITLSQLEGKQVIDTRGMWRGK